MCECYPRTGDPLSAADVPHLMSSNFRAGEEDFSDDSPVWEPATFGGIFAPPQLPISLGRGLWSFWDVEKQKTLSLMAPIAA